MVNLNHALDRPGATLRHADLPGQRRPIVFTHGAGMDHRMFDAQALALHDAGHRVVCWDQRGHGESTLAPGTRFTAGSALADLAALLNHTGARRPVLIGHSLGGNLVQALVRADPDLAHGVVVVGATWNAGPLTAVERVLLRLAAPALAMVPASRLPGVMAKASAQTPAAIAACEETFARMPKRDFLDVWRATVSFVTPDPDYRTPVPLGLVRGECDGTGNIATAMPRWARTEAVTEHVIPGAGHVATLDDPAAVTKAIRELVDEWEDQA